MVHLSMGVSDMRKFLVNILIFFGIVAVIDFAAGKVFWHLQTIAGGRTGAEYYACKESKDDVIVMGSSRASHHYVPQIITDSLGLSCFNAGQDGNGIIMQYGRWKMMSERYAPKLLIYDITTYYDLDENDNMTYIDRLKPFCDDKGVLGYVADIFPLEKLKLMSRMYRYNYKFMEMLADCRLSKVDENRGYFPLEGQIKPEAAERSRINDKPKNLQYDEVKLRYLEELAMDCNQKGTKLVFVVSPAFYDKMNKESLYKPIKEIADRNNIQCLMFVNKDYSTHEEWFKDTQHLNDDGAKVFTSDLTRMIEI